MSTPTPHNPNERLILFSDAVIAITITLLVLEIRLPEGFGEFSDGALWGAVVALWPRFLAFLISFAVIGVYWLNHHAKFELIEKADGRLRQLNLLFLLTICVVPFTTSVIAENSGFVGTALYAGNMMLCGLALALLWSYAVRAGLVGPRCSAEDRRRIFVATLTVPLVFAVSIPLSLAHPDAAKFFWLMILPVSWISRWAGRSRRSPSP